MQKGLSRRDSPFLFDDTVPDGLPEIQIFIAASYADQTTVLRLPTLLQSPTRYASLTPSVDSGVGRYPTAAMTESQGISTLPPSFAVQTTDPSYTSFSDVYRYTGTFFQAKNSLR